MKSGSSLATPSCTTEFSLPNTLPLYIKAWIDLTGGVNGSKWISTHPRAKSLHPKIQKPSRRKLHLRDHSLEKAGEVKYVGFFFSEPDCHITKVQNFADAVLGFLKLNRQISSILVKRMTYNNYLRPRVEHATIVWVIYLKRSIEKVEMFQRRMAHWLLGKDGQTPRTDRVT